MRVTTREIGWGVGIAAESTRPIRLRVGGYGYAMTATEATELATAIADIIAEFQKTIAARRAAPP